MKFLIALLLCTSIVVPAIAEASGGQYARGHGSSHKGGHYKNAHTHDHYESRK
jgi:hypothetical protein